MKAKLSYKSKRNIVITVIILALLAIISIGTYFFVQGNKDASAFTENNMQINENEKNGQTEENTINNQSNNNEQTLQNEESTNSSENSEDGQNDVAGNETTNNINNNGSTSATNNGITNNGTTNSATGNVPNEEYVTERIEEEEVLVSEDYAVEWDDLKIEATTTTANLDIVRPIITAEKLTNNTTVVEGEDIEYTITVTNSGNIEGTAVIKDTIPEQTTFKEDSIKINGVTATHEDGSLYTKTELENGIELIVEAGEEITVSFTVRVNKGATGTIINTAIVNEEETNPVKNPILQAEKIAEVYRDGKLVDVAKVGDTIKYTIKIKNTSEELDVTTNIKDEAPEGTTLIKNSISEGGVLSEDGTILWNEISLKKGEKKEVEFSVTINKDRTTSVENTAMVADMPTNNVVNPVMNVEAVKTSKANNPLYEKGMIEYNITLTNKGNAEGKVTVTDNVPEGTTLVADSIFIDGNTSSSIKFEKDKNNLITWEDVTVGTETPVVLSFKVTVDVFDTDTKDIINNTAKLDDKPINETKDEALKVFVDVIGKKVWEDKDNANNKRPVAGITIQLKAKGSVIDTKTISETGNVWNYEFTKLPKYDAQGKDIVYTVDEVAVDGYAKNISGYTITNSLPNIGVEKSVYNLNGGDEIGSNTKLTVKEGDIVGYKITVTNTGAVTLTNVKVTDTMANGNKANENKIYLSYEDATKETNGTNVVATETELIKGASKTYIVYYKVKANDVKDANVNINNTAKAVGHFANGNNEDETVQDSSNATVSIVKAPKITAVKTRVGSGKVTPGSIITYNITVKNEGNTNLTNVKVFDTMNNNPKGTSRKVTITAVTVAGKDRSWKEESGAYDIGNLNIGQTAVITATYKVTENDMAETEQTITNTAKAEALSDGNAKVESKESKVDVKTEIWKTEITLKKSSKLTKVNPNSLVGATTAEYGDTIKYTITATNKGRKAGTVEVKDYIPSGAELVAYSTTTTNLTQTEYNKLKSATSTNKFSKTLTVLGNGTASIYFTVKVNAKPGATVKNVATDGRDNSNVPEPGNKVEKVVSVTKIEETFQNSNVVVVLDRSRSMQQTASGKLNTIMYNGTNQTRIEVAKQVINKYIIDKMDFKNDGTGSAVSVVAFWGPYNNSGIDTTENHYRWNTVVGTAKTKSQAGTLKTGVNNIKVNTKSSDQQTGTVISSALIRAKEEIVKLRNANPNNKNVVIFISDGGPEGDDDVSNIPTYASNLKNAVTGGVDVYTIGFGANPYDSNNANWKWYLQDVIASSTSNFFRAGSDNMDKVFNDLSGMISPATPVNVASSNGKVELTDVDNSKKVTINGTEKTIAQFGDKIIQIGTTYYVDLSKYEANASITIQYYKKK